MKISVLLQLALMLMPFLTAYGQPAPANYDEAKIPSYVLPELLVSSNGQKIASRESWEKLRRKEILELFRINVYGRQPEQAVGYTWNVMRTVPDMLDGTATMKEIRLIFFRGTDTVSADLL